MFEPGTPGRRFGGRAKGTPNKLSAEIRTVARQYSAEAIAKLVHLMRNSRSEKIQIAAADLLLDRGYGRPVQSIAGPLVNVNVLSADQSARLTPGEAYAAMVAGTLELDPAHPAFRSRASEPVATIEAPAASCAATRDDEPEGEANS
jgi:hypothetical protein